MVTKLYSEESVQAIASAIRAKDGDPTLMTVAQMPARIEPLLSKNYREIWLHGPRQLTNLVIDTGVPGSMEHTLEVVGYGNIYATTVLFGSITGSQSRQMFDMLTTSMKFRFAWGNSGLQTYAYDINTVIPWHPVTVRFNKNGFVINGFTAGFTPSGELTGDYSAKVTGGESTANYCIFPASSSSNPPGMPGIFRSAKVFDSSNVLLHHFVPIQYNDWTLALLDKVTGTEQILPSGEDGFEGYWAPKTDAVIGIS